MASNDVTLQDVIIKLDAQGEQLSYLTRQMYSMDKQLENVEIRLDNLESRTEKLELLTQSIYEQQLVTDARVEMLHHSMNWGFAIMGIVVALMGVLFAGVALGFSVSSSLRADKKEREHRETKHENRENYSRQILLR